MNIQVVKYFEAEKNESLLFILVGIFAIGIAIAFFVKGSTPFLHGMAYPFILVALIQLVVGGSVYQRSPKDILRVEKIIKQEKEKIRTEEIPRMQAVMKNFDLYRWIEIALILIGLLLFVFKSSASLWGGVGAGLAIQALFMLALDFFAERRGRIYLDFIQQISC